MKALIDADYFAYAHGGATDNEGHPLPWPLVASRISQQIENIVIRAEADDYDLYLTGKGNFREHVACIRPYKGNRVAEKPAHYQRVRDYLCDFRRAKLVVGMEADDQVSIELYQDPENTILCSIDKDLDNTPGWHYNWIKDKKYHVEELESLRNFYCQLHTGDTVDNIPGLFGVGKSSTLLKHIRSSDTELDMYTKTYVQYEKRFGSFWWQFLLENAQLLWMLREPPQETEADALRPDYELEVKARLECLEDRRLESLEAN